MTMMVQPARATLLIAGAAATGWALATVAATTAATPSVESIVTAAVAAVGAAGAMGLAALTALALFESLIGVRNQRAINALPAPVRHFLLGSVAVAVSAGVALPSHAEEAYPGWVAADPVPTASAETVAGPSVSPGPVATPTAEMSADATAPSEAPREQASTVSTESPDSDREQSPSEGKPTAPPSRTPAAASPFDAHTVVRGDSLWEIAAEWLGAGASDAEITDAWRAIYAENRDVLGEDPGLILPGQRLHIPMELGR